MTLTPSESHVVSTGSLAWGRRVHASFQGLELEWMSEDACRSTNLALRGGGAARSGRIVAPPQVVRRRSALSHDVDEVCVLLVESGRTKLKRDECELSLSAGDIAVFDNASPFLLDMSEPFEHAFLMCRRAAFAFEFGLLRQGGGVHIAHGPAGGLLRHLLRTTAQESDQMKDAELDRIASAALDLCIAAGGSRAAAEVPRDRVSGALFERICSSIRSSLADPTLSPSTIAEKHRISLRYLHKLFALHGLQVMKFVRDERLAACARELNAATKRPHIAALAARWGFEDDGSFRRAYRKAYGHAPGQGKAG